MNVAQFITTYRHVALSERSVAIQHSLHLCDVLNHPHPVTNDPTGEAFTFEKYVGKMGGGKGFADVWKKRFFAWEYKGPGKDLQKAYLQLQQYRDALENPPLLVVSDIQNIVIHTNFTNTPHVIHTIPLEE